MLSEDYGIIYVEDFASSLALRSENVGFINSYVLWYEWGVGISNSGDEQSRKKMYADNARFYEGILRDDPANKLIKRASIIFRLKDSSLSACQDCICLCRSLLRKDIAVSRINLIRLILICS